MKKFISLVLAIFTIASPAALALPAAASSEDTPMSYKLYDPSLDGQKNAVQVAEGSVYGLRVKLTVPFTAAGFCMPTWSATGYSASIAVYKWTDTFDKTIAADPVARLDLENLRDCATNYIEFAEQPAGELPVHRLKHQGNGRHSWRYSDEKSQAALPIWTARRRTP